VEYHSKNYSDCGYKDFPQNDFSGITITPNAMKVSSGITPLVTIDRNSTIPMYRQVYQSFRSAVMDGRLRAGERVPSTRALALELRVSRIPILNAYAQLLAEGYFESRTGAGTVISRSLPDPITKSSKSQRERIRPRLGPRPVSANSAEPSPPVRRILAKRTWGAFSVGQVAFAQFPFRVWNSLVARHSRNATAMSFDYGDPLGLEDLREAIAAYVRTARAVRCEANQIMIVSGSQHALEITSRVLLDHSCSVWMEEPGYTFARRVFRSRACRIVPIPVDDEGIDVNEGIRRSPTARVAFVSPSHQFPLGATMSASRRLQLIEWAERAGSWIIEDDYDSEYRYETMPIASLQGLDWNERVVYVGTFSKVLFPSLRLGYIVIPTDLVEQFVTVRVGVDIAPPGFFQHVLADFIREGHFSRHVRRMRALYSERRAMLIKCLRDELGPIARISGEQAGTHVTLLLKNTVSDVELVERAAKRGLSLVPLSNSYLGKTVQQGLVLGFGSTPTETIPSSVRKLGTLLRSK
jgi:GntR family transcriptional regulator / MocR family aminotransferase